MDEQAEEIIKSADVEFLAKACCVAVGRDPDEMVPETGYTNARMIPRWWKEVEWAMRWFIAMTAAWDARPSPTEEEKGK